MNEEPKQEVEAKYRGLTAEAASHLGSATEIAEGFVAGEPVSVEHFDVYYDTKAFDVLRHGLALRVRRQDDRALLTAKSLDDHQSSALHQRAEEEAEVKREGKPPYLKQAPDELRALVRKHKPDHGKFRPILALRQTRTQRQLSDAAGATGGAGEPLAELSLDEVHVLATLPPTDAHDDILELSETAAIADFRELELELLPGADLERLQELTTQLETVYDLQAAADSKLVAGLRAQAVAAGEGAKTNIQLDMHMAEATRMIWRQQMMEVVLNEHGVRHSDDPEYVHDMRVSIRRARTAHDLFGSYFRSNDVAPYFKGLRHTGKLLGQVRDLDVALLRLAEESSADAGLAPRNGAKAVETTSPEDAVALATYTVRLRDTAYKELMDWLDGSQYRSLVADFMAFCTTPNAGTKKSLADAYLPRPVQVQHCMPTILVERYEQVRAYESLLAHVSDVPYDQLHALRIQCKFLRYVLEFNRHLLGEPGEKLIKQLKLLQDHLGELNDYAVESRRWQDLNTPEFDKKPGDTGLTREIIQRRLTYLSERSAQLRASFPAKFQRFVTEDNRRLLGEAVAKF